ncbi:MAG: DUF1553 domain-containing protein [Verrucomicrobia bacterium]|nr:DUF1553 domain-containing protein [Verrucomicrobiota bacterium]
MNDLARFGTSDGAGSAPLRSTAAGGGAQGRRPANWWGRVGAAVVGLSVGAGLAEVRVEAAVDFARDIAPIFVKRCTECHGPDTQRSGLRLDQRAGVFRPDRPEQTILVPGDAAASELWRRVTTRDPDDVMPPKGERLRPEQIEALRAWIDAGAEWPEDDPSRHWAFVPPTRPALPAVEQAAWTRNPVDRFILVRLEQEGLAPSPEADRATLIRRLSLDLTGLPPSWAEVETFLRDSGPGAYERVVDRLMASPHYGEHLARWWLDLARYADSNGYQVDLARSIWPYRDWVIRAFNRNLPFDRFTIEQLAGDLLPRATLDQRIATGFHRNSKINDEGGGDAEEYRTKAVKDRVATTATAWLGMTMMCAECHTHKYDPISHEEYYRFYAFFNNTADGGNHSVEPTIPVPPPNWTGQLEYLRSQLDRVQRELAAAEGSWATGQAAWEQRLREAPEVWAPLALTDAVSTGGSSYTNLADGSLLATGSNPIYDTILVQAETSLTNVMALLLEVLPDPSLPKGGPGRWGQTGNFILDELAVWAVPVVGEAGGSTNLVFAGAEADWEQTYYRAEHAIDGNPKTGWAIGPRFGQRHFLIARLREPVGYAGGTRLGFRMDHYHGNSHTLGRFRLSVTTVADPEALWPLDPDVRAVLTVPAAERTADQGRALADHYRTVSPAVRRLERELFRLNQRESELATTKHTTLVLQELAKPRETYVHLRGNFLSPGPTVTAGVPAVLPRLPAGEPANRLSLARWLMAPEHPLTARVTVNRLWERFFGTGLVATSEDFGKQGEAPSHPRLLDWLAVQFQQSGWDLKALQRLLVSSAAYRQQSVSTPRLLEVDPYNRLLARGPRFRLDAEAIRDQALAVSGLLNRDVGGPSVFPVQVANLWKEIGFLRPEIGMDEWPTSYGPDLYRRGLYTFWRRVCTYPTFATFDAPSRDVCVSRRPRTNTPLQALAGLNEPTLLEAARVFAQRILEEGGAGPGERVQFAFRTCLGRSPTAAERERLLSFVHQQREHFNREPDEAARLVRVGSAPLAPGQPASELAAWLLVANVLLNLDETLTKG